MGRCHLGCTTAFAWDRGCKRWPIPELLRRAAAEVNGMTLEDRLWMLNHMRAYSHHYTRRTDHRAAFISIVEGSRASEFEQRVRTSEILGRHLELTPLEIDHEAALSWNLYRQQAALTVLFVYRRDLSAPLRAMVS